GDVISLMNVTESKMYNLQFYFADKDNNPYSNTKYIAYFTDGEQKEGITDEQGNTEIFYRDDDGDVTIKLLTQDYYIFKGESNEK
ncbi:hypothetical protein ACVRBD_004492, partial [Salmonella enterica subsp. enterica]